MLKQSFILAIPLLLLAACNSGVLNGTDNVVQIVTMPVDHAHCTVENKRGAWDVNDTPSFLSVYRSPGPMVVRCQTMDGWKGAVKVYSGVDGRAVIESFPTAQLSLLTNSDQTGFKLLDNEADTVWTYPSRIEVPMVRLTPPPPSDAAVFPPGHSRYNYNHVYRHRHLPPLVK